MAKHIARDAILRWESQELVVALDISVRHWRTPDYVGVAAPLAQPAIAVALATAARDGWQADEPTDLKTLFSRSRLRTRDSYWRWRVNSATIRLTRPVRRELLVPHG